MTNNQYGSHAPDSNHCMKKTLFLLLFLFCVAIAVAQTTYYYERTAVVDAGKRQSSYGDGHFITFVDKGCYDSSQEGYTMGTGFRRYQTTQNGVSSYYGESYFGMAHYYFSADRSLLNIVCDGNSNRTLVYERRQAPSGTTASSRRRSTSANSQTASSGTTTTPSDGSSNSGSWSSGSGVSGGASSNNGSSGSTTSGSSYSKRQRRDCPFCQGDKGYDQINYGTNYTGSRTYKYCDKCRKSVPSEHYHVWITCKTCLGKGYLEY